jgi:TM2 domain-containing membrane protein YozV
MTIDRTVLRSIRRDRDIIAGLLSIIPGLGQVYKGYYAEGILTLLLGVPLVLWIGILLSLATAGISMLIPFVCWVSVAMNAYLAKDIRKYHILGVI